MRSRCRKGEWQKQANNNSDELPHSTQNICHRSRSFPHVHGPLPAPNAPSMPLHVAAGRCFRWTFVITSQKFSLSAVTVQDDTAQPPPQAPVPFGTLTLTNGIEGMLTKNWPPLCKASGTPRSCGFSGNAKELCPENHHYRNRTFPHGLCKIPHWKHELWR
jgi:hypothetical protein